MLKKTIILFIILLFVPLLTFAYESFEEEINSSLLDLDSEISGFSMYDFSKELYSKKGSLDFLSILTRMFKIIFKEVCNAYKTLSKILIPILLYGILNSAAFTKEQGASKAAFIACYMLICATVIYVFNDIVNLAKETISTLDMLTKGLVPILFTLVVSMGNITQATLIQPTMLMLSQILVIIINKYILPLVLIAFALNVTDSVNDVSKLKNFGQLINKFVKWTMAFLMTIFTAILAAQNILGSSFDDVAAKGTKFAVGNLIPVVGSAVSEGVEAIGSSLILLKNITGITGIAGIVYVALIPTVKIYSVVFMFYILSALSQTVTGDKFSDLLSDIGSTTSLLGVLVICSALIFIISAAIILGTNSSLLT